MADNIERQDHEAVEETGMASLQNGNVLDMRDNMQNVEIVHECKWPLSAASRVAIPGQAGP